MKKMIVGLAIGVMLGCALSDLPEVKGLMNNGKNKIKSVFKK